MQCAGCGRMLKNHGPGIAHHLKFCMALRNKKSPAAQLSKDRSEPSPAVNGSKKAAVSGSKNDAALDSFGELRVTANPSDVILMRGVVEELESDRSSRLRGEWRFNSEGALWAPFLYQYRENVLGTTPEQPSPASSTASPASLPSPPTAGTLNSESTIIGTCKRSPTNLGYTVQVKIEQYSPVGTGDAVKIQTATSSPLPPPAPPPSSMATMDQLDRSSPLLDEAESIRLLVPPLMGQWKGHFTLIRESGELNVQERMRIQFRSQPSEEAAKASSLSTISLASDTTSKKESGSSPTLKTGTSPPSSVNPAKITCETKSEVSLNPTSPAGHISDAGRSSDSEAVAKVETKTLGTSPQRVIPGATATVGTIDTFPSTCDDLPARETWYTVLGRGNNRYGSFLITGTYDALSKRFSGEKRYLKKRRSSFSRKVPAVDPVLQVLQGQQLTHFSA